MNVDCQWIENKLESYYCDRLNSDERLAADSHIERCSRCSDIIQEFAAIDPLVKRLFQQNLSVARLPRRRRSSLAIGAFATASLAVILLIAWTIPRQGSGVVDTPAAVISAANPSQEAPPTPKIDDTTAVGRAKPETASPDRPSPAPPASNVPQPGKPVPDFLITDIAGYSRSLVDYRGSVLLFGVLSADQPQAASNLQRVYETFGKNAKLRVVGVLKDQRPAPARGTFTTAYNQGSALLGASPADIVIVDQTGKVQFRGSLLESPTNVLASVRGTLRKLNIQ